MKVYNGWVLEINNKEHKVIGSLNIRGKQSYILKDSKGVKSSIKRDDFLESYNFGEIKYLRSEAV